MLRQAQESRRHSYTATAGTDSVEVSLRFLYELSADEKIVQRILRHATSHVISDRYINAFDVAVMAAMKKSESSIGLVDQSAPNLVRQL